MESLRGFIANEYWFTFLATTLCMVFKGLTHRGKGYFTNREPYDLGLELVFIAWSFAASQLTELVNEQARLSNQMEKLKTEITHLAPAVPAEVSAGVSTRCVSLVSQQLIDLEKQAAKSHWKENACYLILNALAAYTVVLVLLIRIYEPGTNTYHNLLLGTVVPDLLGLAAIALTTFYLIKLEV
jgi:hypothetical protein